jgi:protein gp37
MNMSKSKIEWTDRTWNPVTGCTKVSQGCKNCYAERMYERFHGHGSFKNVITHPERLDMPLKWKKPSMVFVNSMSDLFHEDVPFEFIDMCFIVMAEATDHTFQILTKRPERLLEYAQDSICEDLWPLKNVWLGVSVEDQKTADERIPLLIQVPAAVRFLSCEPLLAPIDILTPNLLWHRLSGGGYKRQTIDWVICGGESGPGSRPMHPDWARSLRDQCEAAGVPFFFKQWGEYLPYCQLNPEVIPFKKSIVEFPSPHNANKKNSYYKIGKKAAGNVLDEKQHLEYPKSFNA